MSFVAAADLRGVRSRDWRRPIAWRTEQGCACRSLLICHSRRQTGLAGRAIGACESGGGAPRLVRPCKFLFFLGRATGARRRAKRAAAAAPHNPTVFINENTMAEALPDCRPGRPSAWVCSIKSHARGKCSATRAPAEQSAVNPRTIRSNPTWNAASGIVEVCRSLLIPSPRRPGGTWGRRGPRHGQRPARRPPSRFTESGGRP
jgi:hypothetical protein